MTSPSKILTGEEDEKEEQIRRPSSPSILTGEEDEEEQKRRSSPSILTRREDEEEQKRRPSSPSFPPQEIEGEQKCRSSTQTFPPEEDEEEQKRRPSSPLFPPQEDDTPPHSHRRRWSTPIESSGGGRSHENLDLRRGSSSSGVNLQEFFSCSSDNRYSFYLGGEISPWGPSGVPPLLRKSRSNAPSPPRRGRNSVTTSKRDLPPFLTTLDCNGRPRFHHRRVRSEGRLEIASVAVDLPEFVSVRGSEGLRIGTVRNSQQHEEEDQDQEQEDDEDDQRQNH